jgi:hypothetical protein
MKTSRSRSLRALGAILVGSSLVLGAGAITSGPMARAEPSGNAPATAQAREKEAFDLAQRAYVYGYPLVLMDLTRRVMTNVPAPRDDKAPMGQLAHMSRLPDPSFTTVVSPNVDTLYSSAWVDVSNEPAVLHVPDTGDRYYLMQMLDNWTNTFASPGKRTTGTRAKDFAIVGPMWTGTLPAGMTEIRSPTEKVWILGRIQTNGPDDVPAVQTLQKQLTLSPLNAHGGTAPTRVDATLDMKTPPAQQVARMDALTFFGRLADLLRENPPPASDGDMIQGLQRLGIAPGEKLDRRKLDPVTLRAMQRAVPAAKASITKAIPEGARHVNGWDVRTTDIGRYGNDYMRRAAVAMAGLGASLPEDAVYPTAMQDAEGAALNGAKRYVLHFDRASLPPVQAFWSVTVYDDRHFLAANPIHRYALGDRDPLTYNPDGSLDLYLQNTRPEGHESNWLPVPKGKFNLIMRLYSPKPEVLDGRWSPPAVRPSGS